MSIIHAQFDGRVFVPEQAVQLPVGTKVAISVPTLKMQPPPPETPEQRARWEELMAELHATEPAFATLEEAMDYSRGRSGIRQP
jgi:hypothetical protein